MKLPSKLPHLAAVVFSAAVTVALLSQTPSAQALGVVPVIQADQVAVDTSAVSVALSDLQGHPAGSTEQRIRQNLIDAAAARAVLDGVLATARCGPQLSMTSGVVRELQGIINSRLASVRLFASRNATRAEFASAIEAAAKLRSPLKDEIYNSEVLDAAYDLRTHLMRQSKPSLGCS